MALESRDGTRASRHVEEGLSRSFSGGGGKPSFPSPSAVDLRDLPRVPLRGEGSCGGGGAPRESSWSGATEEGLISRGGRNLRLPLHFGLQPQGPCRVGTEGQASSFLRKGTPLASRVAQGVSGPSSSCVWNPRVFADDARGWQCPFVCAFTHRVAFEEGSGLRVLLKGGPGIGGVRHVAPPTWLVSNFLVGPASC